MDIRSRAKYPAGALSNFSAHPFVLRGIYEINSMEGFLQGLKFKSCEMQLEIFQKVGRAAKAWGSSKPYRGLWFQGVVIDRYAQEYQDLLDEAYKAMFTQNAKARRALLASRGSVLKHSIGKKNMNETVLTRKEFCSRLTRIRFELLED